MLSLNWKYSSTIKDKVLTSFFNIIYEEIKTDTVQINI